MNPKLS